MAIVEHMFLKAIDSSNETKYNKFIVKHMRDVNIEVGPSNAMQIEMNYAIVCKVGDLIVAAGFFSIFLTPCVVHT